ncbi:restriction endonuclease subunit S [Acinetobacter indicus]|nr:restriction endonuclease subunit S [Acinetobacter indicus]NOJ67564.1 restriction endonuclease subunit S [Acinetobacter indicus]
MSAPKLRFKEFGGDWELDLLGNLVQIKSGYSPSKYELDKSGEMPFLKVEELNNCDKYQEYSRFYTERNSDAVPSKSVVFPKRGAAILNNKVRILRVDALLDSNLMALIPQHSLDAEYLYYLINKIELYKIADTSTIPQINNKHIEPYSIYLPSKEEQTKIASFLSAVDEKISQLTQKHQLLSQYKQGMMQKLFSQQIRFKADDGSEFGEWESKKISDLFDEVRNKVADRDIETYSITAGKGFVSQANKFGRDISGKQNSNYIVLKPNDFSYNKGNSKTYKYGCVYLNELNYDIAVPNVFISFRSKKLNLVHEKFYSKLFEFHYLDKYLRLLISSSARMDGLLNVSKDGFFEIKLPYPCLEEQTKIANFLSAIDQNIEVTAQQIEQAKQWKKGLLQQMFV